MMRIFLLLFIVAISCQQKKRGVVCQRVDANSGQCSPELLSSEVNTKDTAADDLTDLTDLFNKRKETTEDKEVAETITDAITDETLLKDVVIKSECLVGKCRPDDPGKYLFTCTAKECNQGELFSFDKTAESNIGAEDEGRLCCPDKDASVCALDDNYTIKNVIKLKCGIVNIDGDLTDFTKETPGEIEINSELLNKGACVIRGPVSRGSITTSIEIIPQGGCLTFKSDHNRVITDLIELTFSLKQP